jgi:hypothetical protein
MEYSMTDVAYLATSAIHSRDGVLCGELRLPVNFAAHRKGSIHDDERAAELGFRNGPVSGLIHNEQFAPLALHAFGPRWFECGGYSFYYRHPTYDGDRVRAFMRDPGPVTVDVQVEAWSEDAEGSRISDGTISMGEPDVASALRHRLVTQRHSAPLRILRNARPGEVLPEARRSFSADDQAQRRGNTTEPLPWYFGSSPWGGPIAGSLALYRIMRAPLGPLDAEGVQIDGGIEVRFVNGPVMLDHEYLLRSRILAVGQTPRTEYLWFESSLHEPETEVVVAIKLMMCRWLKASSPLYAARSTD